MPMNSGYIEMSGSDTERDGALSSDSSDTATPCLSQYGLKHITASTMQQVGKLIRKGDQSNSQLEKALEFYTQARNVLETSPHRHACGSLQFCVFYRLGKTLYQMNQMPLAFQKLKVALEYADCATTQKHVCEVHVLLGDIFLRDCYFTEASKNATSSLAYGHHFFAYQILAEEALHKALIRDKECTLIDTHKLSLDSSQSLCELRQSLTHRNPDSISKDALKLYEDALRYNGEAIAICLTKKEFSSSSYDKIRVYSQKIKILSCMRNIPELLHLCSLICRNCNNNKFINDWNLVRSSNWQTLVIQSNLIQAEILLCQAFETLTIKDIPIDRVGGHFTLECCLSSFYQKKNDIARKILRSLETARKLSQKKVQAKNASRVVAMLCDVHRWFGNFAHSSKYRTIMLQDSESEKCRNPKNQFLLASPYYFYRNDKLNLNLAIQSMREFLDLNPMHEGAMGILGELLSYTSLESVNGALNFLMQVINFFNKAAIDLAAIDLENRGFGDANLYILNFLKCQLILIQCLFKKKEHHKVIQIVKNLMQYSFFTLSWPGEYTLYFYFAESQRALNNSVSCYQSFCENSKHIVDWVICVKIAICYLYRIAESKSWLSECLMWLLAASKVPDCHLLIAKINRKLQKMAFLDILSESVRIIASLESLIPDSPCSDKIQRFGNSQSAANHIISPNAPACVLNEYKLMDVSGGEDSDACSTSSELQLRMKDIEQCDNDGISLQNGKTKKYETAVCGNISSFKKKCDKRRVSYLNLSESRRNSENCSKVAISNAKHWMPSQIDSSLSFTPSNFSDTSDVMEALADNFDATFQKLEKYDLARNKKINEYQKLHDSTFCFNEEHINNLKLLNQKTIISPIPSSQSSPLSDLSTIKSESIEELSFHTDNNSSKLWTQNSEIDAFQLHQNLSLKQSKLTEEDTVTTTTAESAESFDLHGRNNSVSIEGNQSSNTNMQESCTELNLMLSDAPQKKVSISKSDQAHWKVNQYNSINAIPEKSTQRSCHLLSSSAPVETRQTLNKVNLVSFEHDHLFKELALVQKMVQECRESNEEWSIVIDFICKLQKKCVYKEDVTLKVALIEAYVGSKQVEHAQSIVEELEHTQMETIPAERCLSFAHYLLKLNNQNDVLNLIIKLLHKVATTQSQQRRTQAIYLLGRSYMLKGPNFYDQALTNFENVQCELNSSSILEAYHLDSIFQIGHIYFLKKKCDEAYIYLTKKASEFSQVKESVPILHLLIKLAELLQWHDKVDSLVNDLQISLKKNFGTVLEKLSTEKIFLVEPHQNEIGNSCITSTSLTRGLLFSCCYMIGTQFRRRKLHEDAKIWLDRCLSLNYNKMICTDLSKICLALNDYDNALKYDLKAGKGSNASQMIYTGQLYEKTGQLEAAKAILQEALQLEPQNLKIIQNILQVCFSKSLFDSAVDIRISCLNALTNLKQDTFQWYYLLGKQYQLTNMNELAYEPFKKTVSLKPDCSEALFFLAESDFQKGEFQSSQNWCKMILRYDPRNVRALFGFAMCCLWIMDNLVPESINISIQALKEACEINLYDITSLYHLANLYKQKFAYQDAELTFQKILNVIGSKPNDSCLDKLDDKSSVESQFNLLPFSSLQFGNHVEPKKPIVNCISFFANTSTNQQENANKYRFECLLALSDLCILSDQVLVAIDHLTKALKIDHTANSIHLKKAQCLLKSKKNTEALQELEIASKLQQGVQYSESYMVDILTRKAQAYYQMAIMSKIECQSCATSEMSNIQRTADLFRIALENCCNAMQQKSEEVWKSRSLYGIILLESTHFNMGDWDFALKCTIDALNTSANHPQALLFAAYALLVSGNLAKCLNYVYKLLDPNAIASRIIPKSSIGFALICKSVALNRAYEEGIKQMTGDNISLIHQDAIPSVIYATLNEVKVWHNGFNEVCSRFKELDQNKSIKSNVLQTFRHAFYPAPTEFICSEIWKLLRVLMNQEMPPDPPSATIKIVQVKALSNKNFFSHSKVANSTEAKDEAETLFRSSVVHINPRARVNVKSFVNPVHAFSGQVAPKIWQKDLRSVQRRHNVNGCEMQKVEIPQGGNMFHRVYVQHPKESMLRHQLKSPVRSLTPTPGSASARTAHNPKNYVIQNVYHPVSLFERNVYNIVPPSQQFNSSDIVLKNVIGQGGFAVVHRGTVISHKGAKLKQEIEVAVKILNINQHCNPVVLQDLISEISGMAKFNHPRIVKFIGLVVEGHLQMIITEFCAGGNLHELLHRNVQKITPYGSILNNTLRKHLAIQIAEAVACLHSCKPIVVHRDLKPLNIVLDTEMNVKLCDFGLTRHLDHSHIALQDGHTGGSPRYMAPEAYAGGKLNEKVDIWALGCIVNEIFGGPTPYHNCRTVQQILKILICDKKGPHIPSRFPNELRMIIQSCLQFDPAARTTAYQVLKDLQNLKFTVEIA